MPLRISIALVLCATCVASAGAAGQSDGGAIAGQSTPFSLPAEYPGAVAPGQPPRPAVPDPYAHWVATTLQPWLAMTSPYYYGRWMQLMVNPWVDEMTRHSMLDAMMRSADPRLLLGDPSARGTKEGAGRLPVVGIPGFPTQTEKRWRPNTVTEGVSLEAKRNFYQSMMMMSPLSMRDMVGIMAEKMPVAQDVTFEDAVESMKLRANEVNFKLVAHNPFWRDVRAITGKETPRVEIFQFCDAMVGRQILDYVPEFVVFLPCRIALLEDADGRLWVMSLDWDVHWLDWAQNPNSRLDASLRAEAERIRDAIRYIMEGAATGDF